MDYKVVEIFDSIEGEGKRAGQPATFIRLAGCNLNCTYCDTAYAQEGEHQTMSLESIIDRLKKRTFYRVTLTGGEPLKAPNVEVLIHKMLSEGYEVNIETNGSVDIRFVLKHLEFMKYEPEAKLFFTMDYKLPSSGVTHQMHFPNYAKLRPWDVLKFVVGSQQDVDHMVTYLNMLDSKPQIFIGTVYGGYDLQKLTETILETPELQDARLQLQLHKIIWDANERGV